MVDTNKLAWLVIGALITLVFVTLAGYLVKDYFTTPKAYVWVDEKCNNILNLNEFTRFNPQIKNLGEAPALLTKCISSDVFLIGNNINHMKVCSDWIDLHHQTTETKWALPGAWDVIPDKDIIEKIQNATIMVEVFCEQKIWFLKRKCDSLVYPCLYVKEKDNFRLANQI